MIIKKFGKKQAIYPGTLVTTGRVGSDFFQSLLDGHPEIFSFNGVIRINDFWDIAHTTKIQNLNLNDIITEFIGNYIEIQIYL